MATVLIVEDERELADLYATWLDDEYRVRTAYDGEQALEQLDRTVDVVLLDRRMPSLSGDEVLGRIRERDGEYQVAMVTAVDPDFDFLKLDFDEYVTKPLTQADLQETVEELLIRKTFDADLQRALALAAKKETLEDEKSPAELRTNTTYNVLTTELAEYREQVNDQLAHLAERDTGAYFPYATSRILLDSLLLSSIALGLIAIHFGLPDAQQRLLTYGSPQSNLPVSYLLTFVHHNDAHLYGNVLGYLTGVFFTYALCMRIRAVRWLYLTVPLLLALLPLGTVVISNELFAGLYPDTETVMLGFSSVVAGVVGFTFLALLFVARTIYEHRTVFLIGLFILLGLVDSLLWINSHPLLIITVIGTVLVFAVIINTRVQAIAGSRAEWIQFVERVISLLIATIVFTAFGLGLFPALELTTATQSSSAIATNVFGHFLGMLFGFAIAFSTAFLADIFPIRDRIRREGYSLPDRLL